MKPLNQERLVKRHVNASESQNGLSTVGKSEKRKADTDSYEDGRPHADHSNPANKIPAEIRREIINICNRPEYASMAPCEIVPALADEGIADCQGSCCRHE